MDSPRAARSPTRLGPFRLLRELGAGGMGIVYLAEEEGLGRTVALKLIRPEHLFFPGSRERFQREIEAVARLQHPNIVPIFSVGEEQGLPFFAMEYVEGRSLSEILSGLRGRNPGELSGADLRAALGDDEGQRESTSGTTRQLFDGNWADACIQLVMQVADALAHAHARGVLHRDIKPSNILLTPDGRARLLDFGLARTEGSQQLTQTTTQIGSLPYLPPEQLDESTRIPSERQDIYSLGVTLYELLALDSPFLGSDAGGHAPEDPRRATQLAAQPQHTGRLGARDRLLDGPRGCTPNGATRAPPRSCVISPTSAIVAPSRQSGPASGSAGGAGCSGIRRSARQWPPRHCCC